MEATRQFTPADSRLTSALYLRDPQAVAKAITMGGNPNLKVNGVPILMIVARGETHELATDFVTSKHTGVARKSVELRLEEQDLTILESTKYFKKILEPNLVEIATILLKNGAVAIEETWCAAMNRGYTELATVIKGTMEY